MATTLLRHLVSGRKARFVDGGSHPHSYPSEPPSSSSSSGKSSKAKAKVDLDLVYLTDDIVLMGYPATGLQALYRNRRADVRAFLQRRHGAGSSSRSRSGSGSTSTPHGISDGEGEGEVQGGGYRVYSLVPFPEAPPYAAEELGLERGGVSRFPFPDHHPPPLSLLPLAVADISSWLGGGDACEDAEGEGEGGAAGAQGGSKRRRRVAVIHCKAGKGRSGTVALAYLLTLPRLPSPPRDPRNWSAAERERAGTAQRQGAQGEGMGEVERQSGQVGPASADSGGESSHEPSSKGTVELLRASSPSTTGRGYPPRRAPSSGALRSGAAPSTSSADSAAAPTTGTAEAGSTAAGATNPTVETAVGDGAPLHALTPEQVSARLQALLAFHTARRMKPAKPRGAPAAAAGAQLQGEGGQGQEGGRGHEGGRGQEEEREKTPARKPSLARLRARLSFGNLRSASASSTTSTAGAQAPPPLPVTTTAQRQMPPPPPPPAPSQAQAQQRQKQESGIGPRARAPSSASASSLGSDSEADVSTSRTTSASLGPYPHPHQSTGPQARPRSRSCSSAKASERLHPPSSWYVSGNGGGHGLALGTRPAGRSTDNLSLAYRRGSGSSTAGTSSAGGSRSQLSVAGCVTPSDSGGERSVSRASSSAADAAGPPKYGVSIASQRRWLGYWARILCLDDPRAVLRAHMPRQRRQVVITRIAVDRVVQLSGRAGKGAHGGEIAQRAALADGPASAGASPAASTLDISDEQRLADGRAEARALATLLPHSDALSIHLGRYDDELVSRLEAWERAARKRHRAYGAHDPGASSYDLDLAPGTGTEAAAAQRRLQRLRERCNWGINVDAEAEVARTFDWGKDKDEGKIHCFAKLSETARRVLPREEWPAGLGEKTRAALEQGAAKGKALARYEFVPDPKFAEPPVPLRRSSVEDAAAAKQQQQPRRPSLRPTGGSASSGSSASSARIDAPPPPASSAYGPRAGVRIKGLPVDADRELNVKILLGRTGRTHALLPDIASAGWAWIIPSFEDPLRGAAPAAADGSAGAGAGASATLRTTLRLEKDDIDFCKSALGVVGMEIEWAWIDREMDGDE